MALERVGPCGELSPKPGAQWLGSDEDRKVVYATKEPVLRQLKGRVDVCYHFTCMGLGWTSKM